jgi:hypothetical protein
MERSMPDDMTIDEYEARTAEAEKPEDKPDPSKELNEKLERTMEALRISEAARLASANNAPAPVAPVEPDPPKQYTREELAELLQSDPTAALEYVHQQAVQTVTRNFESRIAPVTSSAVASVEREARQRFATEFELFGDDIKKELDQIQDPSVMTNPQAWEQLVSYVRGKSGNFEKYIDREITKRAGGAREAEAASAGFSATASARSGNAGNSGGNYGLDATQREIADKLGISYADYTKWDKVG